MHQDNNPNPNEQQSSQHHTSTSSQYRHSSSTRPSSISSNSYSSNSNRSTQHQSRSYNPSNMEVSRSLSNRSTLMLAQAGNSSTERQDGNRRYDHHTQHSTSTHHMHPKLHPQQHLYSRSEVDCPIAEGSKRTRWLKAGEKARENQQLVNNIAPFNWPSSHYGQIIYIDKATSNDVLENLLNRIKDVQVFTIDTESENRKSTSSATKQQQIPAIIQIQAIHNEQLATVFIIEAQHLPSPSSQCFESIKTLCHRIFSVNSIILAWGDPVKELAPFFFTNLFNINDVNDPSNKCDLQKLFTRFWNARHPHTSECLRHLNTLKKPDLHGLELICHALTDDLEDDDITYNINEDINDNRNGCICPDSDRPYKQNKTLWSLQKAIHAAFNMALSKELRLNNWTCGLDPELRTWSTPQDIYTRKRMADYAIHDVFGPTHIFFYLSTKMSLCSVSGLQSLKLPDSSPFPSSSPDNDNNNNTDMLDRQQKQKPSFFILSDSHGKFIQPSSTPNYTTYITSIPGLRWYDNKHIELSAIDLIKKPEITSFLSSCSVLVLLIGTNSTRSTAATQIIQQVQHLIENVRHDYKHLNDYQNLAVVLTYPCYKPLRTTTQELLDNINEYNKCLILLVQQLRFTILDFKIQRHHLYDDIHINKKYICLVNESLTAYFHSSIIHSPPVSSSILLPPTSIQLQSTPKSTEEPEQLSDQPQKRTTHEQRNPETIKKRRAQHHKAQREKHKQFKLHRRIGKKVTIQHVKKMLAYNQIKYKDIPPHIYGNLNILFATQEAKEAADKLLPSDAFSDGNVQAWMDTQNQ